MHGHVYWYIYCKAKLFANVVYTFTVTLQLAGADYLVIVRCDDEQARMAAGACCCGVREQGGAQGQPPQWHHAQREAAAGPQRRQRTKGGGPGLLGLKTPRRLLAGNP